jgi:(1->4)-alpha-D-glucan 1-alpha-D-glucosylmutase
LIDRDTGTEAESSAPDESTLERIALGAAGRRRVPRATYRLQFHKDFTFRDAERLVPYLERLGISDLYASPIFRANPGSTHGYDVVDFGELNPEIGSEEDFERLHTALDRHGMGLVVDFVPNHMGIASGANAWWQDVLENGQASPFAAFFDIDWQPVKPELQNQVLLPVLGDHYGIVLENGELELRLEDGAFTIWYYDLPLPVAPPTYPLILRLPLEALANEFAADDLPFLEYQSIIGHFERLAPQDEQDPALIAERMREQLLAKRRLALLSAEYPQIAEAVGQSVREINGTPGEPRTFDALDALIAAQSYRLSYWRVAAEEINYRRFFAINELAAIRQEIPEVFAATHRLLLRLVGEGKIDGVRIDHPDGLWDPSGYFRDLQRAAFVARAKAAYESLAENDETFTWNEIEPALSDWWDRRLATASDPTPLLPVYLVVEKIVEHGESVPEGWLIDGTVGYEFAHVTGGLLVNSANRRPFDELYGRFAGGLPRFADLVYDKKQVIMRVALVSELNVLARALDRLSEHHRRTRDFTYNAMRIAMREIIACFPVYRTYTVCNPGQVTERDRRYIQAAVAEAIRRNPSSDRGVFEFVRDILFLRAADELPEEQQAEHCRFVMKFQQLTGPVMAKGLEDTAFYIYNRLTSLNEVGGDPGTFGIPVSEFHRQSIERGRRRPHAMLSSSTHDTKRSEDVRARISALSEMPREWRAALNRWTRLNRRLKTKFEGAPAPDRNDEYLFYQSLIGTWPVGVTRAEGELVDRLEAYMLKAIREAQIHTSWINPNEGYEQAVREFVRGVLWDRNDAFLDDFTQFQNRVAHIGALTALSQQFLKLTAPGVPDIYQGTELWDFSLVDPDNRRPVDFELRSRLSEELMDRDPNPALAQELVEGEQDGRIKLFLTQRTLAFRRAHPELFANGEYEPLNAIGPKTGNVVAFARRHGEQEMIAVAPRLIGELLPSPADSPTGQAWGNTRLPLPGGNERGRYRSIFTDELLGVRGDQGDAALELSEVLSEFPVALLERLPDEPTGSNSSDSTSSTTGTEHH